jgi:hypothetical protein
LTEHWLHLRTTNPIESTFSPVRARTRVTKGLGNKDAGLAMVFKLLEAAEGRWRAVNGPHLVALVWAGPGSRRAGWSSDQRRRQRRTSTGSPRDHARTGDPQNLTIPLGTPSATRLAPGSIIAGQRLAA